ncbi:MAG: response regulator [Spirulina sp.]
MPSPMILLIEHESSLREVIGDCLREFGGWEVTSSRSIREGIFLCEKQHPDIILIDASTPEIDALLLIEQLKSYSRRLTIPIVLISAKANWFTTAELNQMGFLGAIAKPFNPHTLSAQIHRLISATVSTLD